MTTNEAVLALLISLQIFLQQFFSGLCLAAIPGHRRSPETMVRMVALGSIPGLQHDVAWAEKPK